MCGEAVKVMNTPQRTPLRDRYSAEQEAIGALRAAIEAAVQSERARCASIAREYGTSVAQDLDRLRAADDIAEAIESPPAVVTRFLDGSAFPIPCSSGHAP
jgi:hypothetical protein